MIKLRFFKSLKLAIIAGVIVTILSFLVLTWLADYSTELWQGQAFIDKIESFRQLYDRLPTETEFTYFSKTLSLYRGEESCPCYRAITDRDYSIEFTLDLDRSLIYKSKVQHWQKHGF